MADHPVVAQARELFAQGKAEQAKAVVMRALQKSPGDASLNYTMGGMLTELRDLDRAAYFVGRAMELDPSRGLYASAMGEVRLYQGRLPEAVTLLERSLDLDPTLYSPRINLASYAVTEYDHDRAERLLREAIALRPERPEAVVNLSNVMVDTARAGEAEAMLESAAATHPENAIVASALANLSNYLPGLDPSVVATRHAEFGRRLSRYVRPMPHAPNPRDPGRRLRVAFLSPDFREHSVAYFADAAVSGLPREGFEVLGLYTGFVEDAVTARLKAGCDRWIHMRDLAEVRLAEEIRRAGVDIVIELSGLTQGNSLISLALRPAPVQVTYLGYPNSTGLPAISHRITDSASDGEGADARYTERLVRLDPCFLCYTTRWELEGTPRPAAPARTAGRPVTFGSFNVVSKLSGVTLDAWADILRRVEGSRLVLKARSMGNPRVQERLRAALESRGVDGSRIEMIAYAPSHADHLALYGRVDVALDPFPYTGTTTTCEALSMSTPVLTLRGATHAGRVGASILAAAGMPELIAGSPAEYVENAVALAGDRPRLGEYHRTVADRFDASPVRDRAGFGRRLGDALRRVWIEYCQTPATPG
ncbi:MAG: tetratricopeptide repeat protein [Phycisphaeraceae bacterium]|nr:MAG: tetratricopeptide repeat protein [Phycisphaeraceae bacterium]